MTSAVATPMEAFDLQGKHMYRFQGSVWLESLKHEWNVRSGVEAPNPNSTRYINKAFQSGIDPSRDSRPALPSLIFLLTDSLHSQPLLSYFSYRRLDSVVHHRQPRKGQ